MSKKSGSRLPVSMSVFGGIVRAGLNSAPFTGGIASLWSEWDTSRRFQRVEAAVQQLVTTLERIQDALRLGNIGEAEMHLLEDALQRVSREHREEKRRLFVNVIASSWVYTDRSFEERRLFLRALDRLEELHIRILRCLRGRLDSAMPPIPAMELFSALFGAEADGDTKFGVFVPAMVVLATEFGFMRRKAETSGKVMLGINPDGLQFHSLCTISGIGVRFLDFIDLRVPESQKAVRSSAAC